MTTTESQAVRPPTAPINGRTHGQSECGDSFDDQEGCEFLDGNWVEKNMGAKASLVTVNLIVPLATFCREQKLGFVLQDDTGYQGIFPAESKRVRKPDLSFIRFGRLPKDEVPAGYIVGIAPDLAIEIVSPNDEYRDVQQKKIDYLSASVKLIWIIDPPSKSVSVIRADRTGKELIEGDELDGEDVVTGFRMAVADLFVGV